MLVQFRLKNFLSFRDEQTFSLVADTSLKEKEEHLTENLIPVSDGFELVKTAVVYGANASGKSNLLKAIDFFFKTIVQPPPTDSPVGPFSPFLLDKKTATEPTLLEAVFIDGDATYRYGFEVLQKEVVAEWLYVRRKQETYVFDRNAKELRINRSYPKLKELQSNGMVALTALLLKLGALFNDETCKAVIEWSTRIRHFEGTEDRKLRHYTTHYLNQPEGRQRILELLRDADLGIEDIELITAEERFPFLKRMKEAKNSEVTFLGTAAEFPIINTVRFVFDEATKGVQRLSMPLKSFESEGTQKFFNLIGVVLWYIEYGGILIADELDVKLHPLLTRQIIRMFNSSVINTTRAQLIFATHDTNLLSSDGPAGRLFRRDQIWFTEKDQKGGTQLYALTDYKPGKTVRNDEQLEKNYIAGKYGGIPYLGNFDTLFEQPVSQPIHE